MIVLLHGYCLATLWRPNVMHLRSGRRSRPQLTLFGRGAEASQQTGATARSAASARYRQELPAPPFRGPEVT
jgi:hypothetical protein